MQPDVKSFRVNLSSIDRKRLHEGLLQIFLGSIPSFTWTLRAVTSFLAVGRRQAGSTLPMWVSSEFSPSQVHARVPEDVGCDLAVENWTWEAFPASGVTCEDERNAVTHVTAKVVPIGDYTENVRDARCWGSDCGNKGAVAFHPPLGLKMLCNYVITTYDLEPTRLTWRNLYDLDETWETSKVQDCERLVPLSLGLPVTQAGNPWMGWSRSFTGSCSCDHLVETIRIMLFIRLFLWSEQGEATKRFASKLLWHNQIRKMRSPKEIPKELLASSCRLAWQANYLF